MNTEYPIIKCRLCSWSTDEAWDYTSNEIGLRRLASHWKKVHREEYSVLKEKIEHVQVGKYL